MRNVSTFAVKWPLALLIVLPIGADLLSINAPPTGFWAQFLPSLYYVCIVIAGLVFGWKAALALSCIAGFSHALLSHFLQASPWVRLEAQVAAFLVVGFAFFEEHRKANARRASSGPPRIDPHPCVQQVSEIASEMLHEIRTPLASIEGAAFLLKEDNDLADAPGFLEIILRECRRVQTALAEIGACSEMRPLSLEETEVESLLAEAVRLAALQVPDPSISLRIEVAPNLPPAWCDKKQILELLVSFITGTMRAMSGGGEVLLSADRVKEQVRIRLSVLGQTVRATDPAAGRGAFSSAFDETAGLRWLAARRTLLQHGGSVQSVEAGPLKRLHFITFPIYNGQNA